MRGVFAFAAGVWCDLAIQQGVDGNWESSTVSVLVTLLFIALAARKWLR